MNQSVVVHKISEFKLSLVYRQFRNRATQRNPVLRGGKGKKTTTKKTLYCKRIVHIASKKSPQFFKFSVALDSISYHL